ncbi:MAG: cupin domain-containing protein [Actinobacteria bacterium]|nr:MAG: cupin domain-containing protein [Actinomycetota bacterium]TMM28057.1 MAG: cupin domain-containing protein [Actinomycetota bacterium]
MSGYTVQNLKNVEDQAPKFGLSPQLEARMARVPLELEQFGISYQRIAPGFRVPWGHTHNVQEEVYVVVSGSMLAKLNEDVVELKQWDAVRVPKETMRSFEGGPEGAEVIAVGAPNTGPGDAVVEQGWWSD